MSKIAIVYWSGTGNTETMANCIAEGAKNAGADVEVVQITRTASSPKMNWLPIQVKYTKMYSGFTQNPGW